MKSRYLVQSTLLSMGVAAFCVTPAYAKKVICVDGCGSGFVSNHEGFERAEMEDGDVIQVGGSFSDCVAMLEDGDTLIIVAHGTGTGTCFVWGGTEYTGFGDGEGELPVPDDFGKLMDIDVRFCSCWSALDPDGPDGEDTSLVDKIIDAMGGADNGHTGEGFTGLARASVNYTVSAPNEMLAMQGVQNLMNDTGWMNNPPTNRPGADSNQQTAAQNQLDMRFPDQGLMVMIDGYKEPVDSARPPGEGEGADGCACTELPGCGFGTQDGVPFGGGGCPPGGIIEGEPDCGLNDIDGDGMPDDNVNGGCNSTPPVFSEIFCGDTYCGTSAFNGEFRDTDWYRLTLNTDTTITFSGIAEFDILIGVVDNGGLDSCEGVEEFLVSDTQPAGTPAEVTADLPAGTWYLFVAPQFTNPVDCPTPYILTLTCGDDFACPGKGDCCEANGTPGCEDQECCEIVCGNDPFCCDAEWDQICADEALQLCPELCQPVDAPVAVSQLSWLNPDETFAQQFSDYGQLTIEIDNLQTPPDFDTDDDGILWVNALLDGGAILQNEPLIEIETLDAVPTFTYWFPLPTPPGVPATGPAMVELVITNDPVDAPPPGEQFSVVITEHAYYAGAGLIEPIEEPLPYTVLSAQETLVSDEPLAPTWERVRKSNVPGVAEQRNHCTPGAQARSLAWMNQHYCLDFPEDCDSAEEIYDTLKDGDHMMTTKANGTDWAGRDGADVDPMHPVWGKHFAGVQQLLMEKKLLGDSLTIDVDMFKTQDADDPEVTPCDIFELLQAGKDVVINAAPWQNQSTINNSDRGLGHSITAVGAVKCGEMVTLFYRDDSARNDSQNNTAQTGDNNPDSGVKVSKFVPGGATGWNIIGRRWEGYLAVCPTLSTIIDAAIEKLVLEVETVETVQDDIQSGKRPEESDLEQIQDLADQIEQLACQLLENLQDLDPACPEAVEVALRFKEKAITLAVLAELLREEPSQNTIEEMLELIMQMQNQLNEIAEALAACECPEDLNGDGIVDGADLGLLLGNFGGSGQGDINNSGTVDGADLGLLLGAFGPCP